MDHVGDAYDCDDGIEGNPDGHTFLLHFDAGEAILRQSID
jgi:hypothetical protein